jgi:hypothetical protein
MKQQQQQWKQQSSTSQEKLRVFSSSFSGATQKNKCILIHFKLINFLRELKIFRGAGGSGGRKMGNNNWNEAFSSMFLLKYKLVVLESPLSTHKCLMKMGK